jgi:hypothetical protein
MSRRITQPRRILTLGRTAEEMVLQTIEEMRKLKSKPANISFSTLSIWIERLELAIGESRRENNIPDVSGLTEQESAPGRTTVQDSPTF